VALVEAPTHDASQCLRLPAALDSASDVAPSAPADHRVDQGISTRAGETVGELLDELELQTNVTVPMGAHRSGQHALDVVTIEDTGAEPESHPRGTDRFGAAPCAGSLSRGLAALLLTAAVSVVDAHAPSIAGPYDNNRRSPDRKQSHPNPPRREQAQRNSRHSPAVALGHFLLVILVIPRSEDVHR